MPPEPQAPRRSRSRWRVGLLLVLSAALAALLVTRWDATYDDGEQDVAFRFRVTQAATGRPLPGAFLRFFAQQKVARDLTTGPGGEAAMTVPCPVTVRKTLFSRRATVVVPDWAFYVSSLGHKMAGPYYLRDYVGPRGEFDAASAPAVIAVRMEKQDELPEKTARR